MLITLNSELKANFSSIDKDYSVFSLQSFINDAEQDIVIPWIGQDIFDDIVTYYQRQLDRGGLNNGGDEDGDNKPSGLGVLLPILQKAVTHLAFMLAADSGSFRISDSGYYVVSTDKNKPVSDKKMADFKKGRRESGYKALEQAIEYMEANIDNEDFADYGTSTEHEYHRAYFINSSILFTKYFKKVSNSAYLFYMLLDAVDYVERKYLAPVLGQEYFDQLKEAILDNDLDRFQLALMPYIYRALVNLTMVKGLPALPVDFEGTNLIIRSQPTKGNSDVAEDLSPATAAQISNLLADAQSTAEVELRNLDDYLQANVETLTGYTVPVDPDADTDDPLNDLDVNDDCSPNFFV